LSKVSGKVSVVTKEKDVAEILKKSRKLVGDTSEVKDKPTVETLLAKNRALLRARKDNDEGEELLKKLPQGPGSGLDADTVDGLHAVEIVAKARSGGGGGGGGSGEGMVKHGNEWHTVSFAQRCCQMCKVDELPDEVTGLAVLLSTDDHIYVGLNGAGNPCGCVFPVVDELPELAPGEAVLLSTDNHLYVGL